MFYKAVHDTPLDLTETSSGNVTNNLSPLANGTDELKVKT
jgi:hypothetical protein